MTQKLFFAQKAFIVHSGRLLIVRKSNEDPHNPGKWEVPGGRMDFGEDVDEHIRREVREEVGIEINPGYPFHIWQWILQRSLPDGESVQMQIVAVARLCQPAQLNLTSEFRVDDDYLGEMEWISFSEISNYDFIPNMLPVLETFRRLPEISRSIQK